MGKKVRKQFSRHSAHTQADRIRVLKAELIDRAIQDAQGQQIAGNDVYEIRYAQRNALSFWYNPEMEAARRYWLSGLAMGQTDIVREARKKIGLTPKEAMVEMKNLSGPDHQRKQFDVVRRLRKSLKPWGMRWKKRRYPEYVQREVVALYKAMRRRHNKTNAADIAAYIFDVSRISVFDWAKKFSDQVFTQRSGRKRRK